MVDYNTSWSASRLRRYSEEALTECDLLFKEAEDSYRKYLEDKRNWVAHSSSCFLFETPSFLRGVSRLLDLWGLYDSYNTSETPEEADALAVYSDWIAVGQDFQAAVDSLRGTISQVAVKEYQNELSP